MQINSTNVSLSLSKYMCHFHFERFRIERLVRRFLQLRSSEPGRAWLRTFGGSRVPNDKSSVSAGRRLLRRTTSGGRLLIASKMSWRKSKLSWRRTRIWIGLRKLTRSLGWILRKGLLRLRLMCKLRLNRLLGSGRTCSRSIFRECSPRCETYLFQGSYSFYSFSVNFLITLFI